MAPKLKDLYMEKVSPALMEKFSYGNKMEVPKIEKVVINMGLGRLSDAGKDSKLIEESVDELGRITGQKPIVTKARKSIAGFKLREGMPIGCYVTLRGSKMYEFLDRLVNLALPRVRDFRGVSSNAFDGRGNFTMGLKDQVVFPEVDYSQVSKLKGMNISIITSAKNDEEAKGLLEELGVPFSKN